MGYLLIQCIVPVSHLIQIIAPDHRSSLIIIPQRNPIVDVCDAERTWQTPSCASRTKPITRQKVAVSDWLRELGQGSAFWPTSGSSSSQAERLSNLLQLTVSSDHGAVPIVVIDCRMCPGIILHGSWLSRWRGWAVWPVYNHRPQETGTHSMWKYVNSGVNSLLC